MTDLLTSEAVRFIKEKKKDPFFLYVPLTAVHTPFDEPPKWLGRVDNIDPERRPFYKRNLRTRGKSRKPRKV